MILTLLGSVDEENNPSIDQSVVSSLVSTISNLTVNLPTINFSTLEREDDFHFIETSIPVSLELLVWEVMTAEEAISSTQTREHTANAVILPLQVNSSQKETPTSVTNVDLNIFVYATAAYNLLFLKKGMVLPCLENSDIVSEIQNQYWNELYANLKQCAAMPENRRKSIANLNSRNVAKIRTTLLSLRSSGKFIGQLVIFSTMGLFKYVAWGLNKIICHVMAEM